MELLYLLASLILAETTYITYKVAAPSTVKRGSILLDTSVLIDGRIVPIARSGFISADLIIASSVVRELQFMADKANHDKRERARYGLDVIQELQAMEDVKVVLYTDTTQPGDQVDERLLFLAKKLGARLCTTDYNLNKVARVESIKVLNINELAHALRPMYLPGEVMKVSIIQQGQNEAQGVGYLDDGTMVVVDHAKSLIGSQAEVEIVRMLQTEAGRMLFARLLKRPDAAERNSGRRDTLPRDTRKPQPAATAAPAEIPSAQKPRRVSNGNDRPRGDRGRRPRPGQRGEDSLINLVNGQD